MQIYLIFFLEGHYFLDIQYLVVADLDTVVVCKEREPDQKPLKNNVAI